MKATFIPALLTALLAALFPLLSPAESVVIQWEKIYNGPGNPTDQPNDLAVDSVGNAIVTGRSSGDFYTAKYAAADGALLWEKRYNSPFNQGDIPTAVAVDSADNVIVTGVSRGSSGYYDIYTAKYAAAHGALLWEKRYTGALGPDTANSMAVDGAGNVIITGSTTVSAYEIYTAKYAASNGSLLWEKRYDGLDSGNQDRGLFVTVDGAGNVIVAGYSLGTGGARDVVTAKYAGADGALLWDVRHHGPGTGDEFLRELKLDSEGNAIITGESPGNGGNYGSYTAKYAAANGTLLWEVRRDGGDSLDLALDSGGNVVVIGSSSGGWGNYTAKYAAADGALLWEKSYTGVTRVTVALDNSDNVIAAGWTHNGVDNDTYTAKYAAADGSLLWEMRYNGTGNLNDYGRAVRVDRESNVLVTGETNYDVSAGGEDYYTVKYAPVNLDLDDDGLLDSWETAHFGSTAAHSALDDTDGDGAVELLELAFGTDPKSPASVPTPAVGVEDGYLTTTIAKQPGVLYLVESSATPGAGFSAADTTLLPSAAGTLKVRDNVLIGTQPARFLRVQVTAAP